MANLNPKTLREHEDFNPVRNLWRNVLFVAIEDVVKKLQLQLGLKTITPMRNKLHWSILQYPTKTFMTFVNLQKWIIRK